MAPVTRSSIYGRPSKQTQPFHSMDIDADNDDRSTPEDEATPFQSARDMLLPLQETANRVSRQVEEFAKSLDQFKAERSPSDQGVWVEAFGLLHRYAQVTRNRIQQTAAKGHPDVDGVERQVDSLQLEFNLWSLIERLLKCKCPDSLEAAEQASKTGLQELHRYSTNWDIWDAFLDADVIAQEYESVLDWLQETAIQQAPPLEEVVADITQQSERGDGIWSAGLIYTKDAIKKQKRSRAWPMPLDPSNPGLSKSHVRDDGNVLATQLDPDAPTRENAGLVQADEFHEDAAWQICWEMLRRGMTLNEIRAWWLDRKESWRTAILEGSSEQSLEDKQSPWLRIMNIASNPQWLASCQSLSEKALGRTPFENAVYGVLAGNHRVSVQACKDIEDIFFSYYNAVLIERFEEYLAAYGQRLQDSEAVQYQPAGSSLSVLSEFLESADSNEFLRDELQHPLRSIESAIICQDFDNFFVQQGRAAAQIAHLTLDSTRLIESEPNAPHIDTAQYAAQDQDAVRIVAHLQLILRELGFLDNAYQHHSYQMDNNIVNYIGLLEREAKFSLLPLYASKLSPDRASHVLGTVLIKVTDPREQEQEISLMKRYALNIPVILYGIFQLANYEEIQQLKRLQDASKMPLITEYITTSSVKQIRIRQGFMGDELEPGSNEEQAVRSVQWMRFMDAGNWEMATIAVTSVYKIFLLTGKLNAAKLLFEHVRLASTSLAAVGMNLNLAIVAEDGSVNGDIDMDGSVGSIEHPVQPISPTRRRKESRTGGLNAVLKQESNREELAVQSKIWAQLEQLVEAMVILESWQELADEIEECVENLVSNLMLTFDRNRNDHRQMRQFKRALQEALNQVQNAMVPLFDDDFLTLPTDEDESVQLNLIRNHYIPEIILGYNSVLYFAGHFLTRAYLTQCMNLAQEIAQNDMLTNTFVESGRMRELVNAFALDSQALLRANEASNKPPTTKKGKRESAGADGKSDIWQITWREDADEGDHASR